MASTYLTLIAQLQDTLGRADATTARCDYFIDNAESWFNNNLRVREMESTFSNTASSSAMLAHPADWLQWKKLEITTGGRRCELRPISLEQREIYDPGGAGGPPTRYVVRDSSTLLVPSSTSPSVSGTYYQKIPALGPSQSTNWLLTGYQDAYVYGSLVGAEMFFYNDPRMPTWKSLFDEAVQGIRRQNLFSGQVMQMTYQGPVY